MKRGKFYCSVTCLASLTALDEALELVWPVLKLRDYDLYYGERKVDEVCFDRFDLQGRC
jgi:hypothetical protein